MVKQRKGQDSFTCKSYVEEEIALEPQAILVHVSSYLLLIKNVEPYPPMYLFYKYLH